MGKKNIKSHTALEFDLDVLSGDTDMFRWFLLCYLFGKPIQSAVAVATWQILINQKIDTPWAIVDVSERTLTTALHTGGYTRYEHVTARGLKVCMERLIREYDGSLLFMLESSEDEEEFSKRLQKLYGVGPKIAEIFMHETQELFARRVE
ncbi:DNA methylase [bacterium]|nr:MAG: DNA methylase [bacterium]